MNNAWNLASLGWQPFFQQQLSLEELDTSSPARVMEHHKSLVEVANETGVQSVPLLASTPPLAVGDWVLLDPEGRIVRLLERKSCFRRKAPGSNVSEQLIAANVDTAFIVCSLNEDFNLNRIERYLGISHDAGCQAVVVLSKEDLCAEPDSSTAEVRRLGPELCVESVNCLDRDSVSVLLPWCKPGQTVVMLGSSGSGKSTLTNSLLGKQIQDTGEIRSDDAKGRHTTTRRSLLAMPGGAMILDTPGMREVQLLASEDAINATFADVEALAQLCRFDDCSHASEPDCAVNLAIETGELDSRRLANYQKLLREQALNRSTLAERRAAERDRGRYYKRVQAEKRRHDRGE